MRVYSEQLESNPVHRGTVPTDDLEQAFASSRGYLFALCYRLTGDPSDAEDLVQETFARALEKPPARTDIPLRPWLARVAVNLGIDQLRRRKAAPYMGLWLPGLVDTHDASAPATPNHAGARYDLLESATVAFLVALEELTPLQRAVLLLRDVFDESVKETAEVLDISEANVKTTLHRAREAMKRYDESRVVPTLELQERTRRALEEFIGRLITGDVQGLESMLSESVRAVGDGAGRYLAGLKPVLGVKKVARLYQKLTEHHAAGARYELRNVNGLPALVIRYDQPPGKLSPITVLQLELGDDGRIREVHSVVVPEKLTHVREIGTSPSKE